MGESHTHRQLDEDLTPVRALRMGIGLSAREPNRTTTCSSSGIGCARGGPSATAPLHRAGAMAVGPASFRDRVGRFLAEP